MGDIIFGDKAERDIIKPIGDVTLTNSEGVPQADVTAAILELREFIGWLTREGLVEGGSVKDLEAVRAAVDQPGRLKALRKAMAGGARATVLAAVEGGVAALVAGLLGPG